MEDGKTVNQHGSGSIFRKTRCAEPMIPVAPASRRLLAFWSFNTAGKMPALPQRAASLIRDDSEPIRHQFEAACCSKPPHYSPCVLFAKRNQMCFSSAALI